MSSANTREISFEMSCQSLADVLVTSGLLHTLGMLKKDEEIISLSSKEGSIPITMKFAKYQQQKENKGVRRRLING